MKENEKRSTILLLFIAGKKCRRIDQYSERNVFSTFSQAFLFLTRYVCQHGRAQIRLDRGQPKV